MAEISEWSTVEAENTHLDELTLSGEGGLYTNKIMCAVKQKMDEVDGKLAKVQGAYVFRGTVADMTALEAVEAPDNGDTYSVTALGGENYAWNGTAWDGLGTSDANVVHKTGDETIAGTKTFSSAISGSVTGTAQDIAIGGSAQDLAGSDRGLFSAVTVATPVDANTLTKQGVYSIPHNASNANFPGSVLNGILLVFNDDKGTIKQTMFRKGTINGNDHETWVRSIYGTDIGVWSRLAVENRCGNLIPKNDNSATLGDSSYRWKQLYAASSTINTSDKNQKVFIEQIPDSVLDAWDDVEWMQFKMVDAVAEKGADSARVHSGIVAQTISEVFALHGLNADKYGVFCRDASESAPDGNVYGVRYIEALAIEAASQRRKNARLEERVAALEAKLNGNH